MVKIRKFMSAVVAMLMVVALTPMAAFAAEDEVTLTVNDPVENHVYDVYQLLTGDVSELADGSGKVANIERGANLKEGVEAKAFADAIIALQTETAQGNYANENKAGNPIAELTSMNPSIPVPNGYYLIIDRMADGSTIDKGDAFSRFIVVVTGPTTITPKKDAPSLDKDIVDTDANAAIPGSDNKVDTAAVGDVIQYQLTSKVPDITGYAKYEYVVHDTMSKGLTFNDDVKATVGGVGVAVNVVAGENGAFTITFPDFVAAGYAPEAEILITYSATVNENAEIGLVPNTNTAYLEYSNNPQDNGKGETPEVETYTFVTELVINKIDQDGNPLTGAQFTLTGGDPAVSTTGTANEAGTSFTFTGLNVGDYMLSETVTPEGYNTIADIEFTIGATLVDAKDPSKGVNWTVITTNDAGVTFGVGEDGTLSAGKLSADIVNQSGLVLPSTGGVGTMIFYIVGAVLIVGAVIFFIARRRSNQTK